ncbi:MAG: NAD(P)/FAD-dependent oxidoreductase [Tepidisphaeraceae bacterium]
MELRSAHTPWSSPSLVPLPSPALDRDLSVDVAIIGSGISGALLAYRLLRADLGSVVMLDRRDISKGSIGASTALLQYEMDTRLTDLKAQIGCRDAERAYQLCLEALGHFDEIVTDLGGDCGYSRRQSLYLSGEAADAIALYDEYLARKSAGIAVEYLDQAALRRAYGIHRGAAIRSKDAAEVDPARLTRRLLVDAHARGLKLHGNTGVKRYEPTADGVILHTEAGPVVCAKKVIFATGYETQEFLGQSFVSLSTTFAVVSEPVHSFGPWHDRCLVWEAADPYFYCRTTQDHRIIIGGEDEPLLDPAARDRLIPAKTQTLVEQFHTLFPEIEFRPSKTWAGTFAASDDSMPYIGQHPRFPNGYFALGYGGNGITFALIAARLIRDDLRGERNEDGRLFAFDRNTRRPDAALAAG